MTVSFVVHGVPAPQGSKAPHGGEANPRTRPWRAAVAAEAARAMNGRPPIDGAVRVSVRFCFLRPKSHFRTGKRAGELRDGAPLFMASGPDLDKLCRAIGDALTGIVIRDDRAIATWLAMKVYEATARAEVEVHECQ